MSDATITRRGFLGAVAGAGARALVATGGGLVIAGALPGHAGAVAGGHSPACGAPFGPLHRYLWATGPDPAWMDLVIWRESNWIASAKNPRSTAAGLAQFIDSTWAWGQRRFGIYGSPYDPYCCIDMFSAFIARGEYYHWALTGDREQIGREQRG